MNNLNLKKFDMNSLRSSSNCIIIGRRASGKTYLVKDILYHNTDLQYGKVISPVEPYSEFYQSFLPKTLIHDEYDDSVVEQVFKHQNTQHKKKSFNKAFIVCDDCFDSNLMKKSKHIRNIFMNGRFLKLLSIFTFQFPLGIGPSLRANIDYVFIFHDPILSNRKRLYEHYGGMFPSFDMFQVTMDQCTENYGCLVIDNTKRSNKLEDMVYWYKVKDDHSEHTFFEQRLKDIGEWRPWNHHKFPSCYRKAMTTLVKLAKITV